MTSTEKNSNTRTLEYSQDLNYHFINPLEAITDDVKQIFIHEYIFWDMSK